MISFVIPTLNEEKAIEKTLRCVSAYSGEKEIIVSDGASKDRTVELARNYADRVIVYEGEKRQNIAGGRNAGAAVASGDFLVFIDSDTIIPDINSFFAKVLSVFQKDPALSAMTVFYRVYPEDETWADRIIFKSLGLLFYFYNNILGIGGSGGEFQMIRTEDFKRAGGFNENLAASEDMDLFWRLAKLGKTRLERSLFIYHSGRRAHEVGWPKLLYQWTTNGISALFFAKSGTNEWTQVR